MGWKKHYKLHVSKKFNLLECDDEIDLEILKN